MSERRTTQILENSLTGSKDGLKMAGYAQDFVFTGNCFSVTDVLTIAGSTTVSFIFDCSLANEAGKLVVNLPAQFTSTGGPVLVTIYGGTDYTGVNNLNILNRNANSNINPLCTLKDTATGSLKGVKTSCVIVPGSTTGAFSSSGSEKGELEFVVDSVNYLIEIENQDTNSIQLGYKFIFFEV